MSDGTLCKIFVNRSNDSYKPLACKPLTVKNRTITGHGLQNKLEYFYLTKPNTIREHATLDMLYPVPLWLRNSPLQKQYISERETPDGSKRITADGSLRITLELGPGRNVL